MGWFSIFFFALLFSPSLEGVHKKVYAFSQDPIDVVIPCAPKDANTLHVCIDAIRKYAQHVRRIIVISKEPLTEEAEWFAEARFPFSKEEIASEILRGDAKAVRKFLSKKPSRIGWIFQQFLKLYAPFVIPDISSNVLIVDADVVFLRPVVFLEAMGAPCLNVATEHHRPYFEQMQRLLPGLVRVYPEHSGVVHHMLFQKPVLEDLFGEIRSVHQMEPWKAIARAIDVREIHGSCLSEYELYFNFLLSRTDQALLRVLPFLEVTSLRSLERYRTEGYAYVAAHERP